ncbi:hypothetical protein BZM26_37535 [Paraburkholderia strydomiana]|nr:hypothetical protein BZM26_37535 [Paraburkholderia strydomiana]
MADLNKALVERVESMLGCCCLVVEREHILRILDGLSLVQPMLERIRASQMAEVDSYSLEACAEAFFDDEIGRKRDNGDANNF